MIQRPSCSRSAWERRTYFGIFRTAGMSLWARLAPDVQHVRWALEELRLSLLAQDLRTAFPVSVKRVTALVDAL